MKETKRTIKVSEHIRLDTRPGSAKWQARVKLADGSWHRFSTKTESIERATEVAMKFFYTSEDRLKNNLPQSTRKFRRVAEFARDRMQEELRSGSGHIVYKDYITALDKYLIPFFGSYDVANINAKALVDFGKWRTEQLGRKAHHSTINTHNTALNRVLDEAEQRGWITHAIRPKPINDVSRPKAVAVLPRKNTKLSMRHCGRFIRRLTIPILRPRVKCLGTTCWFLPTPACGMELRL